MANPHQTLRNELQQWFNELGHPFGGQRPPPYNEQVLLHRLNQHYRNVSRRMNDLVNDPVYRQWCETVDSVWKDPELEQQPRLMNFIAQHYMNRYGGVRAQCEQDWDTLVHLVLRLGPTLSQSDSPDIYVAQNEALHTKHVLEEALRPLNCGHELAQSVQHEDEQGPDEFD